MAQDINADDQLKQLSALEGANGYVIFNESVNKKKFQQKCLIFQIGIPLKRHEKTISHEKAVHIAALVSDLWNVSKKVIQRDLKNPDNDIEVIRLRTKLSYEYIITQSGDFTMLATQLCGSAIEEAKKAAAAAAAAAAVVQEDNKEKEKK